MNLGQENCKHRKDIEKEKGFVENAKQENTAKGKRKSKKIVYDICSKSFSSQNIFLIHYRRHTGGKPFTCQLCEKLYIGKIPISSKDHSS